MPNVCVEVRIKPSFKNILEFSNNKIVVGSKIFTFSKIHCKTTQTQVFNLSIMPFLEKFLSGKDCSILVYGQTGSGKTYTMGLSHQYEQGIIQNSLEMLFNKGITLTCSFIEIYNEEIYDLMNDTRIPLNLRHGANGISIVGLKESNTKTLSEALDILKKGSEHRTTKSTKMNSESSRSHAMFIISMCQKKDGLIIESTLTFVDLAGSERLKRSECIGKAAKEAISINCGLLSLGNVISALYMKKQHIPFRDSKLTRILQKCLTGNVLLIACVSGLPADAFETTNTLKYASRAALISLNEKVHIENDKDKLVILNLKKEISALKDENNRLRLLAMCEGYKKDQIRGHPLVIELISRLKIYEGDKAVQNLLDNINNPSIETGKDNNYDQVFINEHVNDTVKTRSTDFNVMSNNFVSADVELKNKEDYIGERHHKIDYLASINIADPLGTTNGINKKKANYNFYRSVEDRTIKGHSSNITSKSGDGPNSINQKLCKNGKVTVPINVIIKSRIIEQNIEDRIIKSEPKTNDNLSVLKKCSTLLPKLSLFEKSSSTSKCELNAQNLNENIGTETLNTDHPLLHKTTISTVEKGLKRKRLVSFDLDHKPKSTLFTPLKELFKKKFSLINTINGYNAIQFIEHNNKLFFNCIDSKIRCYDSKVSIVISDDSIRCIASSEDLYYSSRSLLKLYNTQGTTHPVFAYRNEITALKVEGNVVLTGHIDGTINMLDLRTNTIVFAEKIHKSAVFDICVVDNMFYSCSRDHSVRVSQIDKSFHFSTFTTLSPPHYDTVNCLLSFKGKCVSMGRDLSIKVWCKDVPYKTVSYAHEAWIKSAVSTEDLFVTGCKNGILKCWNFIDNSIRCIGKIDVGSSINCMVEFNGDIWISCQNKKIHRYSIN